MEDQERRSERLAADLESENTILRERISRSISQKNCVKVFKLFVFWDFEILEFQVLRIWFFPFRRDRPARPTRAETELAPEMFVLMDDLVPR
jgi:hypothetical protein